MKSVRRVLLVSVVGALVLGVLAAPGSAAPEKKFSLNFPTSVSAGSSQSVSFVLKNETPNGNSNINSFTVTGTAPSGTPAFKINSINPGTGVVSNAGRTISVTNITTLKPLQSKAYVLNVDIPSVACGGGSITWTGTAFTGNSLNGDPFKLQDGSGTTLNLSQLTSNITTGCTTISVNKYEDADVSGGKNGSEAAPSTSFSFQLKQGATLLQTKSTTGGVATFDPVASGNYTVCEVSKTGWTNTDPGGTACRNVTASGGTASVTFGNAADITINVLKFQDVVVDGVQDTSEGSDEGPLSGWEFKLYDSSNTQIGTAQTTGTDGTVSFTAPAGAAYKVCETSQTDWFSTTGGDCQNVPAGDATSGASIDLSFGNALGNLNCPSDNTISSTDGQATVTRLANTDGTDCTLKPASVTHTGTLSGPSGENVEFLVTGSDQLAAYKVAIDWDPVDNNNPPVAPATKIDLPGGTHPMEWCVPDSNPDDGINGDLNDEPDLPGNEVGCIVSQTWNIVDATHVQETEVIYLEADIVLSKKT